MDLKIFDLQDFESRFRLAQIPQQARFDASGDKNINIAIFYGGKKSHQINALSAATSKVVAKYEGTDVHVNFTWWDNDNTRVVLGSPFELTQEFLKAHIHVASTHWHQGMLRTNHRWNMDDLLLNKEDWKYHLGFPCGQYIGEYLLFDNLVTYSGAN
jgi:hypothetical protein